MPNSFVILLHTGFGPDHYDFMLDTGEALATWQLAGDCMDLAEGRSMPARKLPDHRPAYLAYEGPVSRGRGHVRRVREGAFEILDRDESRIVVRLNSLEGAAVFELTGQAAPGESGESGDEWTITRRTSHC